jgi:excisionase family DNA binding protein
MTTLQTQARDVKMTGTLAAPFGDCNNSSLSRPSGVDLLTADQLPAGDGSPSYRTGVPTFEESMHTQTYNLKMTGALSAAFFGGSKPTLFQERTCRLLTTVEAAEYLNTSPWTVRRLVYRGELKAIRGRIWKFDRKDLDRWIERVKR